MAFSVLMSVYKSENPSYFQAALESVIDQSLVPDEIVLIQDGPLTPELYEVIAGMKEKFPGLVTYAFKENVQLGRALAKGVSLCQNELIARMDTDDIALKDRFMLQYQYMKNHPDVSVCGGYMQEFCDDDAYTKVKTMPLSFAEIKAYAKLRNPVNHMTVMFRKKDVLDAGNYQHFPFLEDYFLWSRMLAKGRQFANIPQVLVKARTSQKLYERRGGMAYFLQYQKLRRLQKEMGLLQGVSYYKAVVLTCVMTLQPAFLRKIVYRRILRK